MVCLQCKYIILLYSVNSPPFKPPLPQRSRQTVGASEHTERLLGTHRASLCRSLHLQHVEAHSLRQRSALANGDNIAILDKEGRRDVGRHRLVALLVPAVLPDVLKVVPPDDNRPGHLRRDNNALQDAAANRHVAREGALLVNVRALREARQWCVGLQPVQHTDNCQHAP